MKVGADFFGEMVTEIILFNTCQLLTMYLLPSAFTGGAAAALMLVNLVVVFVVTIGYLILRMILKGLGKDLGLYLKALLFFALNEIGALIVTRQVSMFGIFETYNSFQQLRDMGYSIAGLVGAGAFVIIKQLLLRFK